VESRKNRWVGKRQVDGTRPVSSRKGKPGVDAWGVEEGVAQVCGSVKVWGGLLLLFRGEEAVGVRCGVVAVELAGD